MFRNLWDCKHEQKHTKLFWSFLVLKVVKCLPRTPPSTSWGWTYFGSFLSIPPSQNQSVQSLWGWESLCGTSSVPYLLHWTVLLQSTATLVYLCTAEVSKTNQTICYLKAIRLTCVVIQKFSAMAEQNLVEGKMFWEAEVWHNEMCLSLSEPLQNYTQRFLRRHGEALLKTWASGYSPQERKITSQMSSRQQWEYMERKWRLLLRKRLQQCHSFRRNQIRLDFSTLKSIYSA